MTKALMFQGTGSDVGKTVLVAGLCRLASNHGIKVMPFKPQNMSNNAAVADDGGEIGRGQWLQALAARISPSVHMNPVLLKPQSETGSQIIVHGQLQGYAKAGTFKSMRGDLLGAVLKSYEKLQTKSDLILVEGAGSPAEINLREGDIANMGFARHVNIPVVLIGDIDRGGVIASLAGTHRILPRADRDMIKAYLINKFRGDIRLFDDGISAINDFTRWTCLGIIPWLDVITRLPAEDSVILDRMTKPKVDGDAGVLKIAIPRLPRIANFDDFDPLISEPALSVEFIEKGEQIPEKTKLVILPGSKSTMADLTYLKDQGWAQMLSDHIARGGYIIGICGGYQMLGHKIYDSDGVESSATEMTGFGFLDIETHMKQKKITRNVTAYSHLYRTEMSGYEIHIGCTTGEDCRRPFSKINGHNDGAVSADGRVMGTYLHGLFTSGSFRKSLLADLGIQITQVNYHKILDDALNELAFELEKRIDFKVLLQIAKMTT